MKKSSIIIFAVRIWVPVAVCLLSHSHMFVIMDVAARGAAEAMAIMCKKTRWQPFVIVSIMLTLEMDYTTSPPN